MRIDRALLMMSASTLLSGCFFFHRLNDCHRPQEYQRATQLAPLKVPPGLDSPNTQGALVIPVVDVVPPPPGKKDPCLDAPPRYKAAPPNKAASSTSG
jgi:uncharacterized lipoprotein